MFVVNIFILFLASAVIQESRAACKWGWLSGQPGERRYNRQPECRDREGAYTEVNSYEAGCDSIIDLDIQPCYINYHGFHAGDNYQYSLDITLEHPQTNRLFAQNLNFYNGLRVRKLQVSKGENMTRVPQEIYDLDFIEILDLSDNSIEDADITSFVFVPSLNVLDLSSNKISDLNLVPVNAISKVTKLYLKSNRIKTFPVNLLYYFPKVEELHLDFNIIDTVTLTDFKREINLKKLYLTGNKLTSINGDGFRRLSPNLEYLSVQSNSITKLPTKNDFTFPKLDDIVASFNEIQELDSFENYPKITGIFMEHNKVAKITKNIFETNKDLKWLTLYDNPIHEIESNSFQHNTKLMHVDLGNTFLKSIESFTFKGFNSDETRTHSFVTIDLRESSIVTIKYDAFKGVRGLYSLYLKSNKIQHISNSAFDELDSLNTLDISHNQLKSINFKTNGLRKLKEFYLQYNKIEKISKSVFENLVSLKILDLSFNNIKEIDAEALLNLKDLNLINFSNNKDFDVMINTPLSELRNLGEFQLAETGITALKNRSISYCSIDYETTFNASLSKIEYIEYNAFGDGDCLRTIILSHNRLTSFHLNANSVKNLKELLLDNNQISNIESFTFNDFKNLERIHLQNNPIVHVDANALQNPKLTYLYISSTVTPKPELPLSGLSKELAILFVENFVFNVNFGDDPNNLYRLHLKSCGIKDLGTFNFSNFRKLEELNITYSDLSIVSHDKLKDLTTIYKINFSKNKIFSLAADSFSNMPKLYHLDLSNNMISEIPNGIFHDQKKFASLSLSNNALRTFDVKALPPTGELILDNNPLSTLDFDYVFNANINQISVGHTVSCENLANAERISSEKFKSVVTADPLNLIVRNINGIPC